MSERRDRLEGKAAPVFSAPDQDGETVTLKDLRGRPAVLYFYPRDFTPGCTQEACDFRDSWKRVTRTGAAVLGVSRDPVELHKKFVKEYKLPFRLLADPGAKLCRAYKVWGRKSLYGRSFMGIIRSTFVIDAKGTVRRVWRAVKVEGHVDEVLAALGALA